jgi:hypothetical protein
MIVSNNLKMLILSRWVDLVPLCVIRIVPSHSPWGATSGEELTSALYRCVGDCHSIPLLPGEGWRSVLFGFCLPIC